MKTRIALITMLILACLFLSACGGETPTSNESGSTGGTVSDGNTDNSNDDSNTEGIDMDLGELKGDLTGKFQVEMEVDGYGIVEIELDADAAPLTVENFIELVGLGFYDGLTFHRIMEGFMAQGGDPEGTGMGGSSRFITGEFELNGISNPISHTRGTISMARSKQPLDSARSQFFIVHQDSLFLDGEYAAFGKVTRGMEVIDGICEDAIVEDRNGKVARSNQPVINYIKMK